MREVVTSNNNLRLFGFLFASLALCTLLQQSALSQPQQFANVFSGQKVKKIAPPLPQTNLSAPVEIPDVPQFSGKQSQFQTGAVEETPTSLRFREYWLIREDQSEVVDWYKSALMNYQWKIKSVTFDRVSAKKEKATVEVMVLKYPVLKNGFRCQLLVRSTRMK